MERDANDLPPAVQAELHRVNRQLAALHEANDRKRNRGEELVLKEWTEPAHYVEVQTSDGVAIVRSGVVVIENPRVGGEVLPFDFRVTVDVEEGRGKPRATVRELTIRARPGGAGITSTGVHAAQLGRVMVKAVEKLTDMSPAMARSRRSIGAWAMKDSPERKSDARRAEKMERLKQFTRLHNEAVKKGQPYAAYVSQRMNNAYRSTSMTAGMARQLKRQAIAAGFDLLEP